jgi:UDP-N-acetyl-2-amino-2-deoxyglucuronate dehydrogenase
MAPWRGTYSLDGGCITNQGIHHIDLLRYLGGEVDRVAATMQTLGVQVEIEDAVTAAVAFQSGAVGSVDITTAARPIDYEASISLVCENGLAQIGGIAVNELQVYTPAPTACAEFSEDFAADGTPDYEQLYGHGHKQIYREIVGYYQEAKPFSLTYEDALKTIRLLNTFYVADEKRAWCEVASAGDSLRLGRPDERLADLYRTAPAV